MTEKRNIKQGDSLLADNGTRYRIVKLFYVAGNPDSDPDGALFAILDMEEAEG